MAQVQGTYLAIDDRIAYSPISVDHRYDFDLRTGKSETGLTACTYAVEIRTDPTDGVGVVWMETPEEGSNWRLVQLQPVSEGSIFISIEIRDLHTNLQRSRTRHLLLPQLGRCPNPYLIMQRLKKLYPRATLQLR
jgi:hypothetical protein